MTVQHDYRQDYQQVQWNQEAAGRLFAVVVMVLLVIVSVWVGD